MYNNELYHYGVKGMKWGRRKNTKGNPTTSARKKKRKSSKKIFNMGFDFVNRHMMDMQNLSIQQANQMAQQQAIRDATNASLIGASLSMSGGTNPFMFGMM